MAKREKRFRPDQRPKLKSHADAPKRGLTPAEEAAAAAYEASLVAPKPTVIAGTSAPIGSRAASTQRICIVTAVIPATQSSSTATRLAMANAASTVLKPPSQVRPECSVPD